MIWNKKRHQTAKSERAYFCGGCEIHITLTSCAQTSGHAQHLTPPSITFPSGVEVMSINRRDFLRGVAGTSGAVAAGSLLGKDVLAGAASSSLPNPNGSGIEHIVIVMMENRSFDHVLGWLPGAKGMQAGLQYPGKNGELHSTYRLRTYVGCGHPDPDHSYQGGRDEYNHGKMNGWLQTTTNDIFCIGYYEEKDLPFFSAFATNFTTLDNYFPSILSSTFPNRVFFHAAQTDRLDNSVTISTLPTIWDSLAAAGVSNKYYYSNVPFLALWGAKYIPISALYPQFLLDAASGNLPAVCMVDPRYTLVDDGEGNDDHPHADMRSGEHFLGEVYQAVTNGPGWANTVLIVTRDEWGGFFDHIVPPRAIAPNDVDPDLINGKALLGCRVPVIVASPFSRGNPAKPKINSWLYDHTSILKLIEWRYGLSPLTARDAAMNNLANALDFKNPDASVPALPMIKQPKPTPCGEGGILDGGPGGETDSYKLLHSPLIAGWPLPPGLR
jgi:phospholipase C